MQIYQLAPNVFVGAQITPQHLEALAREGFTDIVCNRPDAEHPEGPVSRIMSHLAAEIGVAFHYLPITPGAPLDGPAQRFGELASRPGAKIFAYCRSGARASNAWDLAQARHEPERLAS